MLIFLDANILFSAAQQGSPAHQFVVLLSENATLTTHPGVWDEAKRNLEAKRPQWLPGFVELSRRVIRQNRMTACPDVGLPPKDQPVLAAAIALRADRFVTGDRSHFGPLFGKTIGGVLILSPQLMVSEMKALGWR